MGKAWERHGRGGGRVQPHTITAGERAVRRASRGSTSLPDFFCAWTVQWQRGKPSTRGASRVLRVLWQRSGRRHAARIFRPASSRPGFLWPQTAHQKARKARDSSHRWPGSRYHHNQLPTHAWDSGDHTSPSPSARIHAPQPPIVAAPRCGPSQGLFVAPTRLRSAWMPGLSQMFGVRLACLPTTAAGIPQSASQPIPGARCLSLSASA
jgi:hypothetical protein